MGEATERIAEKVVDVREAVGEAVEKARYAVGPDDAAAAVEKAKDVASAVAGKVTGAVAATGAVKAKTGGSKRLAIIAGVVGLLLLMRFALKRRS